MDFRYVKRRIGTGPSWTHSGDDISIDQTPEDATRDVAMDAMTILPIAAWPARPTTA